MAKKSFGNTDQLIRALESRIDELQEGIESSVVVEASNFQEVLDKLGAEGFDIHNEEVIKYAKSAFEYIEQARKYGDYSVDEWYHDTCENYPEDLDNLM